MPTSLEGNMAARRIRAWALLGGLSAAWLAAPARALPISLTFDPSGGAISSAEQAVWSQAASAWGAVLSSPDPVGITVRKATLTGGLLGLASGFTVGGNGLPVGGTVEFESSIAFFVDPTPGDSSEFNAVTPTFLQAQPSGPAAGAFDLLTVALHEVGHILGFTCNYASFCANVTQPPAPETLRDVYAFSSAPTLGSYSPSATFSNGAVYLIDPSLEEEAHKVGGLPSHLDDVGGPGLFAAFFPEDLMNKGTGFGERRLITDVDLDILRDAHGFTIVPEPTSAVLLLGGLAGLSALRRRRDARTARQA
ncbi:MAG: VPLPA-CTERM sorting domain-containing protein [Myxococcota bacterium]